MPVSPDREYGLEPRAGADPFVLILGSFPSKMSLEQGLYYANPRNHFWKIMSVLLGIPQNPDIGDCHRLLEKNHIALWDVIASRKFQESAMDRDIRDVALNDIAGFICHCRSIRFIVLNGGTAWKYFRKSVQQVSIPENIVYMKLTSSSPANARYSIDEKIKAWSVILDYLK